METILFEKVLFKKFFYTLDITEATYFVSKSFFKVTAP